MHKLGESSTSEAHSAEDDNDQSSILREVLADDNIAAAWDRVRANKGGAGVDGITVGLAARNFGALWAEVRESLKSGTWGCRALRLVEIPKSDGRIRTLGIPCVMDRVVQTAIVQILSGSWEKRFSIDSYGYRKGKGTRDAVKAAQRRINNGYPWIVKLDIADFFDSIDQGLLFERLANSGCPADLLAVIRVGYDGEKPPSGLSFHIEFPRKNLARRF